MRKSYGAEEALRGVDLDIAAGEIVGLLGPNGAGKTTMVSIIAGLRRADAGSVSVNGVDALAHPDAARRQLGLAPQELAVYPSLSTRENLRFFGELADLRGRGLAARIDEVAHTLALTEFLDRQVRTLSGGEKRRVHTAMALLHRPPLLLLDEPTTGVDVSTRAQVLAAVRALAADGAAVCYSTHYLAEVEALDASVAILDHGQMIARGTMDELIQAHGGSAVELVFDGPPPNLPFAAEVDGDVVRVRGDGAEAARVLQALGEGAERLRSLEILRPSLESVFLALTGRRYASDDSTEDDRGETARVPVS